MRIKVGKPTVPFIAAALKCDSVSVLKPPKRWPSSASLLAFDLQKHSETH